MAQDLYVEDLTYFYPKNTNKSLNKSYFKFFSGRRCNEGGQPATDYGLLLTTLIEKELPQPSALHSCYWDAISLIIYSDKDNPVTTVKGMLINEHKVSNS